MSDLNIHQRMNQIMKSLCYIQKEGQAPAAAGGYKFVKHDDVAREVRNRLLEFGVNAIPTVAEHHSEILIAEGTQAKTLYTQVAVDVAFINIDKPDDRIVVRSWGYGLDRQDKSVGKAISYAVKYAMLKAFCLETGDDPEADAPPSDPPPAQRSTPARNNGNGKTQSTMDRALASVKEWAGVKPEEVKSAAMSCFRAMNIQVTKEKQPTEADWKKLCDWVADKSEHGVEFTSAVETAGAHS